MPINCHVKPSGKARQSKAWHGFSFGKDYYGKTPSHTDNERRAADMSGGNGTPRHAPAARMPQKGTKTRSRNSRAQDTRIEYRGTNGDTTYLITA